MLLRRVVVGDGEGHDLLQGQAFSAVCLENGGTDAGEFQALRHHGFGNAETRGDIGNGDALVDEVAESLELVGGVHIVAQHVFEKADFARVDVAFGQLARHRMSAFDLPGLGEQQERRQSLASGDNGELLALLFHDEILLQAVRLDAGGKFVNETLVLRLADVAFELGQLVQGNVHDVGH